MKEILVIVEILSFLFWLERIGSVWPYLCILFSSRFISYSEHNSGISLFVGCVVYVSSRYVISYFSSGYETSS